MLAIKIPSQVDTSHDGQDAYHFWCRSNYYSQSGSLLINQQRKYLTKPAIGYHTNMKNMDNQNRTFIELSLSAQSAYAELFDQCAGRSINALSGLSGSFHSQKIKGKSYIYFVFRNSQGAGQKIYVGPENERTLKLIERAKNNKAHTNTTPLVRSAAALGCQTMANKHFRIVNQLANYGFFKAGGILVGTHAFLAMGNMLGVKWNAGNTTLDVDFAHAGKNISIALPANIKISVHDALTSLEMGLLPITQLSGNAGAQYRNPDDQELRVDFLTTIGKHDGSVLIDDLGLTLEPLKFMEFSLENTTQAIILGKSDVCLVNIPSPERFAVHKLIVYGERKPSERVKSLKDLGQAAAIFDWHAKNNLTTIITEAIEDAMSRDPGWRARLNEGLGAMIMRYPELEWAIKSRQPHQKKSSGRRP